LGVGPGVPITSVVPRLSRLPLWAALLAGPVLWNLFALAIAAVGYYGLGWRWAPIAVLPVWWRCAGRLLRLVDGFEISESQRALAVVGGMLWLVASFVLIFAAVDAVEQLVRT
jgi:hypothetical protein